MSPQYDYERSFLPPIEDDFDAFDSSNGDDWSDASSITCSILSDLNQSCTDFYSSNDGNEDDATKNKRFKFVFDTLPPPPPDDDDDDDEEEEKRRRRMTRIRPTTSTPKKGSSFDSKRSAFTSRTSSSSRTHTSSDCTPRMPMRRPDYTHSSDSGKMLDKDSRWDTSSSHWSTTTKNTEPTARASNAMSSNVGDFILKPPPTADSPASIASRKSIGSSNSSISSVSTDSKKKTNIKMLSRASSESSLRQKLKKKSIAVRSSNSTPSSIGLSSDSQSEEDRRQVVAAANSTKPLVSCGLNNSSYLLKCKKFMNKRLLKQRKIDRRRRRSFIDCFVDDALGCIMEEQDGIEDEDDDETACTGGEFTAQTTAFTI